MFNVPMLRVLIAVATTSVTGTTTKKPARKGLVPSLVLPIMTNLKSVSAKFARTGQQSNAARMAMASTGSKPCRNVLARQSIQLLMGTGHPVHGTWINSVIRRKIVPRIIQVRLGAYGNMLGTMAINAATTVLDASSHRGEGPGLPTRPQDPWAGRTINKTKSPMTIAASNAKSNPCVTNTLVGMALLELDKTQGTASISNSGLGPLTEYLELLSFYSHTCFAYSFSQHALEFSAIPF